MFIMLILFNINVNVDVHFSVNNKSFKNDNVYVFYYCYNKMIKIDAKLMFIDTHLKLN